MAAGDENLRAILDHRGAPPRSKEERKYYESMMRRLGYTEAEMAAERAPEPVPEPAPEPEPVAAVQQPPAPSSQVVEETGGSRLIELEYGGAEEIPEFEPVRPKIHPTQVEETEYEVEEVEADELGDNEFVLIVPDDEGIVEFDAVEEEEELVEFTEVDDDWDEWEDPDAPDELEAAPEPVAAPPARVRGHRHKDFTLYRRELDGGQHVYFYSRKAPTDAEPADLPEGYGVKESEESGLPFLARLDA